MTQTVTSTTSVTPTPTQTLTNTNTPTNTASIADPPRRPSTPHLALHLVAGVHSPVPLAPKLFPRHPQTPFPPLPPRPTPEPPPSPPRTPPQIPAHLRRRHPLDQKVVYFKSTLNLPRPAFLGFSNSGPAPSHSNHTPPKPILHIIHNSMYQLIHGIMALCRGGLNRLFSTLMGKTLFQKVWERHAVGQLPDGSTQLFIGTHLIHEVTSPQAFGNVS